jgi:hypothetical protein
VLTDRRVDQLAGRPQLQTEPARRPASPASAVPGDAAERETVVTLTARKRTTEGTVDGPVDDLPGDAPDAPAQAGEFSVRPAVRLNAFLAAGAGLVALLFAIAALSVGGGIGSAWRWLAASCFAILALRSLRALRAKPLLVADFTGIRLRIGADWIGSPWQDIESVQVLPRRHLLDDGMIAVHLSDPGPVVAGIAKDGRRATRKLVDTNRRLTGSSLAVPFGVAATPSEPAVVSALTTLAGDRCPVTEQV